MKGVGYRMKKTLLLLYIAFLILFLSGCGIFTLNGWITPADDDFIACIEELDTPQEIGNYMQENFTYQYHSIYAPDPYQLWLTKNGDCNDMSTFSTWVANYHGYENYQIEIFYRGTYMRHWVGVYDEGNKGYSITNNQYYDCWFDNFKDIVDYSSYLVGKTWTKFFVYDYWNDIIKIGYNISKENFVQVLPTK